MASRARSISDKLISKQCKEQEVSTAITHDNTRIHTRFVPKRHSEQWQMTGNTEPSCLQKASLSYSGTHMCFWCVLQSTEAVVACTLQRLLYLPASLAGTLLSGNGWGGRGPVTESTSARMYHRRQEQGDTATAGATVRGPGGLYLEAATQSIQSANMLTNAYIYLYRKPSSSYSRRTIRSESSSTNKLLLARVRLFQPTGLLRLMSNAQQLKQHLFFSIVQLH